MPAGRVLGRLADPADDDLRRARYFAPGRLASWTDYQTTVHVAGLGVPTSGADASLHVLSGSDGEYAVSVSVGWVRILRGRTSQQALVLDRAIGRGDAHDVDTLALSNGRVTVAIDGVLVYDARAEEDVQLGLPAGGVGLSVYRSRPDSPKPVFSGIRIEPIGRSADTTGV